MSKSKPHFLEGLEGFFGNDTYDYLGILHAGFLESARRRVPGAAGVQLAESVIDEIVNEIANHAPPNKVNEICSTSKSLLRARKPPHPFVNVAEKENWNKEGQMEKEAVRWAGFAVLLAIVSGAAVYLLARRRAATEKGPPMSPSPSPRPTPPTRLAVAVFASKLREVGQEPARAGDLLTQATYWWAGAPDAWTRLYGAASLFPSSEAEIADDVLVVLQYELPSEAHGSFNSRPDAASRLREAARRNELKVLGKFIAQGPERLAAAGFRR